MVTTAKTPYMHSRVRQRGGDGLIEKITAIRASQNEKDADSKLSLQYNNSSIPYLQRNRKKYNDIPVMADQAKMNPMHQTAGGAFQVKARLQNNLLHDYQVKMLPKLNFWIIKHVNAQSDFPFFCFQWNQCQSRIHLRCKTFTHNYCFFQFVWQSGSIGELQWFCC